MEPRLQGLLEQLRALGPGRIMALGGVALALLAFFGFVILRSFETPYTLLFGGLQSADTREIIGRLEAAAVPYRLSPAGDAVMVPADRALRLRMDLAQDGIPAGGSIGYEVFDRTSPLGTTDFLSNLNLRRALEGELARTIGSLRGVAKARVHLVMPRRELFERDRQPPSASIVLGLRGTMPPDARQLQGVRNLVATAVPGLEPGRVTIVDDRGNLLARALDGSSPGVASAELDEQRNAFEQRLKSKIVQLLERTIGPGRVEAEVTADIDFDDVTTTAETFDPNSQVARSTQTVEDSSERRNSEGKDNVSVGANLPTERANQSGGNATAERSSRSEETSNFEISRTLRNQTRRGGAVRRLSIAVQVDGIAKVAPDGTRTVEPRGADELAQLAALVRSAAGTDEERGDVVEVVSRAFVGIEPSAGNDNWLSGIERDDYWRGAELALLTLLTLGVLAFGVRPLARSLMPRSADKAEETTAVPGSPTELALLPAPVAGQLTGETGMPMASEGSGGRTTGEPRQDAGQVRASLVAGLAKSIESRPDDAVSIIRGWLQES